LDSERRKVLFFTVDLFYMLGM